VDLERRHAERRPHGCPDFGGVIGERREVEAGKGRLHGELRTGQLHAVAGITGKTDHHGLTNLAG
jgi:hypothetical protein